MSRVKRTRARRIALAFAIPLTLGLAVGATAALARPVEAEEAPKPPAQEAGYAGPDFCANCHEEIHAEWEVTRHSQAFSSPIFQQNWQELGSEFTCLPCHTTGYDASASTYAYPGVTRESCHGPFQPGHPEAPMPVTPDAELCATCHKTTTDEWHASPHGQAGINCQSRHNPHSQAPMAESVSALCTNCHRDTGRSFTHGTHANAGLECCSCHMYTSPRSGVPIGGLFPTRHTFTVGSEACIGCHQDTVHTRDTILPLTGEIDQAAQADIDELRQQVQDQSQQIADLQASSTVRLYTRLAQGAIIGLIVGGVAAWIVSRRIQIVEVEGDGDGQEEV